MDGDHLEELFYVSLFAGVFDIKLLYVDLMNSLFLLGLINLICLIRCRGHFADLGHFSQLSIRVSSTFPCLQTLRML